MEKNLSYVKLRITTYLVWSITNYKSEKILKVDKAFKILFKRALNDQRIKQRKEKEDLQEKKKPSCAWVGRVSPRKP